MTQIDELAAKLRLLYSLDASTNPLVLGAADALEAQSALDRLRERNAELEKAAAAAVDGDAQWNAGLEEAAKIVAAYEGPHRYVDDMVDAICSLKRLK